MDKTEQLLSRRIVELAQLCHTRDIPTHTDFLNLNEQTIFHGLTKTLPPVSYELAGGYSLAERKIVCFLPSYGSLAEPPFSWVKIEPKNVKFSDQLIHRDYLGAILNLGITRSKVGDILIEETQAYVVVLNELADFVVDHLVNIKHTSVSCELCDKPDTQFQPELLEVTGSVASLRLDAVIAMVHHLSRGKIQTLIEGEKVFVNGKLIVSTSYQLKENDVVSVRGLGKFFFQGVKNQTKKGRIMAVAHKYV